MQELVDLIHSLGSWGTVVSCNKQCRYFGWQKDLQEAEQKYAAVATKVTEQAEQLAKTFHETYERLAPTHGYETRKDSAVPWESVPEKNKNLMIAVCQEILSKFKKVC